MLVGISLFQAKQLKKVIHFINCGQKGLSGQYLELVSSQSELLAHAESGLCSECTQSIFLFSNDSLSAA